MSHYECPASKRAGDCRWPVKDIRRADKTALRVLQPNLGRYLSEVELKTLATSEPWHAFRWHTLHGIPIALRWNDILIEAPGAEEGEHPYPDSADAIEELLFDVFREREKQEPKKEVAVLKEARRRESRPRRFV